MKAQVTKGHYNELIQKGRERSARLLSMALVIGILIYVFVDIVFAD